jgi:hypothetical protein
MLKFKNSEILLVNLYYLYALLFMNDKNQRVKAFGFGININVLI